MWSTKSESEVSPPPPPRLNTVSVNDDSPTLWLENLKCGLGFLSLKSSAIKQVHLILALINKTQN